MKVEIVPYLKKNLKGIDVIVHSNEATVEDYCLALEQYIINNCIERMYYSGQKCEGCDICCQERIPLTSVDVLRMKGKNGQEYTLQEFFKRYAYIMIEGRTVDIALGRDYDGKCIYLDKEKKRCKIYNERPLVCRTYICTVSSHQVTVLRDVIVNTGMDELVRMWFSQGNKEGFIIHEAIDPSFNESDWKESVWTGKKKYSEILIKEVVPASLWEELRKKGEQVV